MEIYIIVIIAAIIIGLVSGVKEKAVHKRERKKLEDFEKYLDKKRLKYEEFYKDIGNAFQSNYCAGRKWLASFISEAKYHLDNELENYLKVKSHPAFKAAEVVSQIKNEKRELNSNLKFLEYQLKSYEEYFPFLEEFKEVILDERIDFSSQTDNVNNLENIDPINKYLSKEEYEKLSTTDKNQLALDRYIQRSKSNWEIGLFYERYLGYLMEKEGWKVNYQGAIKGFEDFGRDLICSIEDRVKIIQAKCWSQKKLIHEKHIFQLYATCIHFILENPNTKVFAEIVTTTELSSPAQMVANNLNVGITKIALPYTYPMIKCNINQSSKEKIYHLPFDQQYDRTIIDYKKNECYVNTIIEAESLGFRRAYKYNFPNSEAT